ncbi:MAG: formylglycine-generating enzyme family protein [Rhodoferax sp.]
MEVLKWLAVTAGALFCGYLWHKLTGNWTAATVVAVGLIILVNVLLQQRWSMAFVVAGIGVYLVFSVASGGDPLGTHFARQTTSTAPADPTVHPVTPQHNAGRDTISPPASKVGLGAAASAPADSAAPPSPVTTVGSDGSTHVKDCADCPGLVVIPSGQFVMGSETKKADPTHAVDPGEGPVHKVSVRSFAAGQYAVTKGQFAAFVRATQYRTEAELSGGCFAWEGNKWTNHHDFQWREAGFAQTDDQPVVCVSWNDAQAYVQWLSQTMHQSYRLLSESEREYVTRAGSNTVFWWGDMLTSDRANFDTTAADYRGSNKGAWRQATVPVGSFTANPFGLYNVHGNVWEWVQDCQHDTYAGAPADGSAWVKSCEVLGKRAVRGGAWSGEPEGLRSRARNWFTPDFRSNASGFRVARSLGK